MINLLWLAIILIVETGLLWGAYKLLGKPGIFAFGAFAVVQGAIFANTEILVGSIAVVPSMIAWVLLLVALIVIVEKFGVKEGIAFGISCFAVALTFVTAQSLIYVAQNIGIPFTEILRMYGPTLAAILIDFTAGIFFVNLFKKTKLAYILRTSIVLAILIVIDVIVFNALQYIGIEAVGGIVTLGLANLWQKAIVFALMIPVLFAFSKTKSLCCANNQVVVEEKIEAIIVEEPAKVSEPAKKAEKKPAKKTAEKKPATKKEVAKKPTTKKTTAKKSASKKTK